MKRTTTILVALLLAAGAVSAQSLAPVTLAVTNYRGEALYTYTNQTFFVGDPILFTNCVAYAGTTTNTPQDLTNCTVQVTLGDPTHNAVVTGTVVSAAAGTWCASATIQDTPAEYAYIEVRLIATNGVTFTYPLKRFLLTDRL